MTFKFFNIGKANAEIDRLESELATAKTAAPKTEDTQKLSDALASNDQISKQLTDAQANVTDLTNRLTTAGTDLSAANGSLTTANASITAAATALRTHLASLPGHADYKDGGAKANATLAELITAEQNATNAAVASTGVKADKLPAVGAVSNAAATPKNLTEACLKANKAAVAA